MRRFGFLIVVSLLVGCSSSPAGPPTTAAAAGGASPFDPLPSGISVKDAYTSVLVQVNNPATFPVAGTDGKFHVAYNLLLQNASQVPATIRKLEVVDATSTSKVFATFSGKQLVDPACNFGDCNRLQALPATPVKDTVVPPQQARVLFVDYSFGSPGDAPKYVMHHLYFDGAASPVTTTPVPVDYTVTPYSVSTSGPAIIGPPLKGKNWVALNGCCEPGWPIAARHCLSTATLSAASCSPLTGSRPTTRAPSTQGTRLRMRAMRTTDRRSLRSLTAR
jgi:hypothetical protein